MRIELDDAIKVYAKACHAWYGDRARQVALGRAQELRARGDWEGVKVWEQLAACAGPCVVARSSLSETQCSHRMDGAVAKRCALTIPTRPPHHRQAPISLRWSEISGRLLPSSCSG